MGETYYDRLGLDRDADTDEVEAAFRECLTDVHPDVSDAPDAGERTRRLIEAREVLTDEVERARYDRLGHEQYLAGESGRSTANGSDNEPEPGEANTQGATATTTTETESSPGHRSTGATGTRTERGGKDVAWRTSHAGHSSAVSEANRSFRTRLLPAGPSLIVLFGVFVAYPILLGAAVLPAFPLVVNVVVGICLVGLVVALQSMPVVASVIFGTWTVVLPLGLWGLFGLPPGSPASLVALAGTALPLGLSTLTAVVLRL